jgi:uncharacterized protein (DUF1330 family)
VKKNWKVNRMEISDISRRELGTVALAAGAAMASPTGAAAQSGTSGITPMKMRSIIVNELTVTNPARYKVYQEQVPATLALFGGQYVSRGEPEPLQGDAPSPRVVILEFPSREKALAWFHSPEFQKILAIRNESSTSRAYFVEGQ